LDLEVQALEHWRVETRHPLALLFQLVLGLFHLLRALLQPGRAFHDRDALRAELLARLHDFLGQLLHLLQAAV
jgi:hypothetical protein